MFTLDVPNEKLANLKKLLNKDNVSNKTVAKSADGLSTTLKFKTQYDLDKAVELLAQSVVDQQVASQAELIHTNSVGSINLRDTQIDWCADKGDPTVVDGIMSGDAYYDSVGAGVILTPNSDNTEGHLYWQKNYDLTKNIYIRTTTYSGEGTGADGITIYLGTTEETTSNEASGGIAVYIDEFNDDTVKVYKNGVLQQDLFYTNDTLDNQTFRLWEIIHEYVANDESYLHVLMNNTLICRVPLDGFVPSGNFVGIGGLCIGLNNYHICRSFALMSGNPWLKVNR